MAAKSKKRWMQSMRKSVERRGTSGVCSGKNFGGPNCKPGSKRYALAVTLKKMARNRKNK